MTISSTTNRVSYAGDGGTTGFSFPHRFLANADLTVILVDDSTGAETPQTLTTDYTVSGAGDANGGTVTMNTAPETGETLVIVNDPDLTQGTALADGSALPAESVETVFDKLTILVQRTRSLVTRSFRLSDGDTSGASLELPSPTALNLVRWDSSGMALENVTLTDLGDSVASVADNEVLAKKPGEDADGLAISEQRVFGRITGGDVDELTPAEIIGIIDDVPVTLASAPVVSISGTDTYTADLGGDITDGERFVGKIANDSTVNSPSFENTGGDPSGAKTITTRDGSALWAGSLSGEHTFEYDGTADTFLVLDPNPSIQEDPVARLDTFTQGHIDGLELSNGTDSDHDIDIATGVCSMRDGSGNRKLFELTSSLTKQIDADWAEGTDAGGFASGLTLSADTCYHVFLIGKDDGSVDAGFDTDASATNLLSDASSYSWFRRIGSVLTNGSSNIVGFTSVIVSGGALEFLLKDVAGDYSVNNPGTSAVLRALTVPTGIKVEAIHSFMLFDVSPDSETFGIITSPDQNDVAPSSSAMDILIDNNGSAIAQTASVNKRVRTDTSGQIRTRLNVSSSDHSIRGVTFGWVDWRR